MSEHSALELRKRAVRAHELYSQIEKENKLGGPVVLNLETGEWVEGKTIDESWDLFEQKFPNASGFGVADAWGDRPFVKHPTTIDGFRDMAELAYEICRMEYGSIAELLVYMSYELSEQSQADAQKERWQLSNLLLTCAGKLIEVQHIMARIWNLCKPHMKEK